MYIYSDTCKRQTGSNKECINDNNLLTAYRLCVDLSEDDGGKWFPDIPVPKFKSQGSLERERERERERESRQRLFYFFQ